MHFQGDKWLSSCYIRLSRFNPFLVWSIRSIWHSRSLFPPSHTFPSWLPGYHTLGSPPVAALHTYLLDLSLIPDISVLECPLSDLASLHILCTFLVMSSSLIIQMQMTLKFLSAVQISMELPAHIFNWPLSISIYMPNGSLKLNMPHADVLTQRVPYLQLHCVQLRQFHASIWTGQKPGTHIRLFLLPYSPYPVFKKIFLVLFIFFKVCTFITTYVLQIWTWIQM